jgi:hypothetical protein
MSDDFPNETRLSYSLRKYDYAMYLLNLEVRQGLAKVHDVLKDIASTPTSHGGTIRLVSAPKTVETPMRKFSADVTVEGEWLRKTDVDVFIKIVWDYCQVMLSQVTRALFETVDKVTNATGNVTEVKDRNLWDTQIEAMKQQDMRFDKEGNHGYKFYAHPSTAQKVGPPTPEQVNKLDKVIKAKREEYNAKKRSRRLS